MEFNLVVRDLLFGSGIGLGAVVDCDLVRYNYVVRVEDRAVKHALTVFDQSHEKVEPHLLCNLIDALTFVINEVLQTVNC